jgi:hypothetical protein
MTRPRPPWLRKLGAGCHADAGDGRSPTERFRAACELMAFARAALRRQAAEAGVMVDALLARYERAQDRFVRRVR